ncbi:hypothetical protein SAMN05720473_101814 [Fibrobacter sp. UWB15]|uniref:hypothetical protein n=1 Tax=unclassified Fibrobacter TaxID=2634177 RepID=UPI000A0A1ABF|nr:MULTISPECIES: hypothetical protein [unclassified Fibrobacter]PWJ67930.1 hypothetical protein BGW99_101815 [Fibrobacter sp. UWB6]SMG16390.1 hypothetical protein SAMN05720473_101814 [Fibrobacter sp. UWB15]
MLLDAFSFMLHDITLDAYMAKPIEVRLANLQWLAELSENRNFIEAVRKQQQKRGVI